MVQTPTCTICKCYRKSYPYTNKKTEQDELNTLKMKMNRNEMYLYVRRDPDRAATKRQEISPFGSNTLPA